MTETLTAIALSTVGIIIAQYCKGVADSTAYDEKARQDWERASRITLCWNKPNFTRYHTGDPNDAWHWFSRLSVYLCYASALGAGAYIGISWWLILCVVCNTLGGLIGFNLGDRFKGSMWMRALGKFINRSVN